MISLAFWGISGHQIPRAVNLHPARVPDLKETISTVRESMQALRAKKSVPVTRPTRAGQTVQTVDPGVDLAAGHGLEAESLLRDY